ncbi:MAG TPA: M55 family metallopeptidase, partial [Myxococcus sp.]|nr:M55 family metallopeptidase [Myxococcus sp.]
NDYAQARLWMTREANAAIRGAILGGATRVVVNDSHGDMRNLLLDELDSRAEIISGALKPLSMVQGLELGRPDAAMFVGYHGGSGTRASVLDHTYFGAVVGEVRVHPGGARGDDPGLYADEATLNALVAGEYGVPVVLVTGDQAVTGLARERLPGVTTVEVKRSITRFSAHSLHPEEARRRIELGALEALRKRQSVRPYTLPLPLAVTVSMLTTAYADVAELIPGVERLDARRLRYTAASATEMLKALLAMTKLAGTVVV